MAAQQKAQAAGPTPVTVNLAPIAPKIEQVVGIQYLRAFAALAVVIHHTIELARAVHPDIPTFIILAGASGVDIFFVISGFIMVTSAFAAGRAPLTPFEFLSRRIQRIYPLYWLLALPLVVLIALGMDAQQHHTLMTTIRAIFLLPSETNIIWYSWTLKYEMFFYAMFTLCLFSRSQLVTTFGTACLLAIFVLLAPDVSDHATGAFLSNPIVFEFSLGLGLGVLYNLYPHLFRQRRVLFGAVAAFAALFIIAAPQLQFHMDALMGPMPDIRLLVWGVPAAAIVAWGVGLKPFAGRTGAFLLLLGNASYALYLVHFFVMKVYKFVLDKTALGREIPQLILGPIVVVACIALAIALHLFYEKPVARLIKRLCKERPANAVLPQSVSRA